MIPSSYQGLFVNAALLLLTTLLYDLVVLRHRGGTRPYQLVQGLILGGIGLAVMASPWVWQPGTVFDTRSVVLSIGGLFFGTIPTTIALLMTAAFRLLQGGAGAWTGTGVILTSGLIGLLWRRHRKPPLEGISAGELYLLGVTVSAAMLLWMFSLPAGLALPVLRKISLPVLCIYPLATLLMGLLLRDRLRRREEYRTLLQTRKDLHERQSIFTAIVDQAADAIGLVDIETGRFIEFNAAAHNTLGYSREEFARFTIADIEGKQSAEEVRQNLEQLRATDGMVFTTQHRHRSGALRDVRVSTRCVWIDDKPFLAAIWSDITERNREQAALVASEKKYRQLYESLHDAYVAVDMTGALVDFNPAYREMLGYSAAELRQKTYMDLTPEAWRALEARIVAEEVFPRGYSELYEKEYRRKDGSVFPVELRTFLLRDEGGEPSGMWSIIRDISERKKLEAQRLDYHNQLEAQVQERTADLQQAQQALLCLLDDVHATQDKLTAANAKLRELDNLKSMFIASMSHELRTPLNAIIGFSSILQNGMAGDITPEQKDMLARVGRAGHHLLALITDIIDISKIESGKIGPVASEFLLATVVHEAVETIRQQAEEKGLCINLQLPGEPIQLHSDRKRLLQCLLNLLSNAVKFTEQGEVKLEIMRLPEGRLQVAVRDTGIGIPAEELPLLFNPFVRLDSPLKMTTTGTGLGLYLTHKLAEEILGGTVQAQSSPGKGSVFTLEIPREMPQRAEKTNGKG